MKVAKFIHNLMFLITVINCEKLQVNLNIKPKEYECKFDSTCTNLPTNDVLVDVAKCNETSGFCTNYCYVDIDCKTDFDCNYSLGERRRCGSECYKLDVNDTIGICKIMIDEGGKCGYEFLKCREGLECDIYSGYCISSDIIDNQTGEPLFSLFLFMLIMLSLFNRQRADEDLLNNMGPNELLMVSLPTRRRPQEEDTLPVYRPIDDDSNEDELIEQNIPELNHPNVNQQDGNEEGNNDQVIMMGDEDDLPLLPPSYDEAVSGYINNDDDNNNNNNSNSNVNINENVNSSS